MTTRSFDNRLMLYSATAWPLRTMIEKCFPDLEIVEGSHRGLVSRHLKEVSWLVGWRFPRGCFAEMPRLRWVQSISVGIEDWIPDPSLSEDVIVTSTKGLYADAVAEYVVWATLSLSRHFHVGVKNQLKRKWVQIGGSSLAGKTVGILGMGRVGKAVARRLAALDMRCIGVVRGEANPDDYPDTDELVEFSEFDSVLDRLDVVVLCVPLTAETRGVLDGRALGSLKKGAVVINVGREGLTDYASLSREINRGHLQGAALDVFEKEPLRRWSPLWKRKNLLLSAHSAGLTGDYKTQVANLVCENIERQLSGRPLLGLVDRVKGY